jgi:hypothetical protein
MKKILLSLLAVLLVCILPSFNRKLSSTGEIGTTGSPGEGLCTGCHGGGPAGTSISVTAVPGFSNSNYVPGQVYSVTVTVSHPTQPAFGFDCEILTSSNTNAGAMSAAGSGMQFANFGLKKNATHTAPKSGSGSASWTFQWTAPNSGTATFYVSGNAVNLDNNTSGDFPSNMHMALTPVSLTSIKEQSETLSELRVFPNPSAEICSVSYQALQEQHISIDLFDLSGKLVKNVINEKQDAGSHTNILDLKGIAKGVYFVKIASEGNIIASKMICIQ